MASPDKKPYTELTTEKAVDALMQPDGGSAVIDFWAPWCGPCRAMAPHFEAVATEYADEPVQFFKVNTEAHPSLGAAFQVRALPTLLFVHNGEIVDSRIGATNAQVIADGVDVMLSKVRGEGFFHRLMGKHKRKRQD